MKNGIYFHNFFNMIKFRKDVDQELEEGEISGEQEPHQSPSPPVIQSRPKAIQKSEQQSESQEYVYQRIKIDERSPPSANKKERNQHKIDEKAVTSKNFGKNPSKSPEELKGRNLPPITPYYSQNQNQTPYNFHPPEYHSMRFFPPNQGYHHFPSFPPNQHFPSQFSHQHQMKNYPPQWNQSRKNHQMRANPIYIDDQYQNYAQNQHLMHQGAQQIAQFEQQQQMKLKQQQKEVEKRNKQKQEAKKQAKKIERKRKVDEIKEKIKQKVKDLEVEKEEKQEIISLIREAVEVGKPSENIIDLIQNKMLINSKVKESIKEILVLLQGGKVLEKLKERQLLRRIVGEKKIMEAEQLYEKFSRDPRLKKA